MLDNEDRQGIIIPSAGCSGINKEDEMKTKMLLSAMVLPLIVGMVMAGEYQAESKAYEQAFSADKFDLAATLATTGVGKGNALNAAGLDLLMAGDTAAATAKFQEAITADPENYWAHNNLGVCLVKTGDFQGAIAEFKLSVEVNSKATDPGAAARVKKATENIEAAQKL
jgi:Flp pilus assembly protein TadD